MDFQPLIQKTILWTTDNAMYRYSIFPLPNVEGGIRKVFHNGRWGGEGLYYQVPGGESEDNSEPRNAT